MHYSNPKTVEELLDKLDTPKYYILNGGTDLLIQYNQDQLDDTYRFIDISKIKKLNYINEDEDNVYIGANVKYHQLENSNIIKNYFKSIVYAASEVGSRQIRNLGTIIGNICNASPGGDLIVILNALQAKVVIKSKQTSREVLVSDFVTGFRKNCLQPKEFVSSLIIPKKQKYNFYKKYGVSHSKKVVISNAGIAATFNISNHKLCNVKVVFGACHLTSKQIQSCSDFFNQKSEIDLNEWLSLVDKELRNLTEQFYELKIGHLKACAADLYEYITKCLEEDYE